MHPFGLPQDERNDPAGYFVACPDSETRLNVGVVPGRSPTVPLHRMSPATQPDSSPLPPALLRPVLQGALKSVARSRKVQPFRGMRKALHTCVQLSFR